MKTPTIFISYNPGIEIEETLAVRLHTIGAVNGFRMFLPDRYSKNKELDNETKSRIQESDWFVIFSTTSLSTKVIQEIEFAFSIYNDKTKIIVIYDERTGKNLKGAAISHFTDIYINPETENIDTIINTKIINKIKQQKNSDEQNKKIQNGLLALLGIGAGLLIMNALFSEE